MANESTISNFVLNESNISGMSFLANQSFTQAQSIQGTPTYTQRTLDSVVSNRRYVASSIKFLKRQLFTSPFDNTPNRSSIPDTSGTVSIGNITEKLTQNQRENKQN
jgi:hypothetical protein